MIDDLMHGIHELDERRDDYELAKRYFDGTVEECFNSKTLRKLAEIGNTDGRMRFNLAKKVVTSRTSKMSITALNTPDDAATQLIREVWDANQMDIEGPDVTEKSCMYGDGYVIAWPSGVDGEAGTPTGVDMFFNSPLTTVVVYDEENPRLPVYAVKRWHIGEKKCRANLYYGTPDEQGRLTIEKWQTVKGKSGEKPEDWEPYVDDSTDEAGVMVNPYGFPVFHFRTARPYGRPLHWDAFGPQDALNKLTASQMASVDFYVGPQRYAVADGSVDADDADDLDDETTLVEGQTPNSNLQSGAGTLWWLRGVKAVGQFDPPPPNNFLDPMEFWARAMAETTGTSLEEFDSTADMQSGQSRRRKAMPMTKEVEALERSFGGTWSDLLTFALHILGVEQRVSVKWGPIEVVDDPEGWAMVKAKQDAGVPTDQALIQAGQDDELVEQWVRTDEGDDMAARVALAAQMGTALTSLATAMQLGVVSEEQVAALVERLIPEDEGDATAA